MQTEWHCEKDDKMQIKENRIGLGWNDLEYFWFENAIIVNLILHYSFWENMYRMRSNLAAVHHISYLCFLAFVHMTKVERDTVREKCLIQERNTINND